MTGDRSLPPQWLRLTARAGAQEPSGTSAHADVQDLNAVYQSDEVVGALAERRALPPDDPEDAGIRLLRALNADVDEGAPPLGGMEPASSPGGRRRGRRAVVAISVLGAVLASTGVAAAGGFVERFVPGYGADERPDSAYARSRAELQVARDAVVRGRYDDARESLDRVKRGRSKLKGPQAADIDKNLKDIEKKLAPAAPKPSPSSPAPSRTPAPPTPGQTPSSPAPPYLGPSSQPSEPQESPKPGTDSPGTPRSELPSETPKPTTTPTPTGSLTTPTPTPTTTTATP